MAVYYINLLLILGLGAVLCVYKPNKIKKAAYLVITFGYMWFLATFRSGIGFDYKSYIEIFGIIRDAGSIPAVLAQQWEPGFELLTLAMTKITNDPVVMYGIYAALIYIPVAVFIFFYCKDAWLSVWLYVTLSYFYSSMNFIRANLACGVVLLGYKFLREKKPVPYLVVVLVAASFHKTALIMLPAYFLCHIRLTKKVGIIYAAAALSAFLVSPLIVDLVTDFAFTGYKGSIYIEQGLPIHFLMIPFILFGACLALRPVWQKRDPDANMLTNLMLFSAVIWLFITRHFILERFSHFIYLHALVAIPAAVSSLKAPQEDYRLLEEQKAKPDKKSRGKSKEENAKLRELTMKISDHNKYYWSAVAALILITFIYNEYGQNVNNFHNVFPYRSVLPFL